MFDEIAGWQAQLRLGPELEVDDPQGSGRAEAGRLDPSPERVSTLADQIGRTRE